MYVHCKKCHHEWECTGVDDRNCNWCGGGSNILEGETPLERVFPIIEDIISRLKSYKDPYTDRIARKIEDHKKGG